MKSHPLNDRARLFVLSLCVGYFVVVAIFGAYRIGREATPTPIVLVVPGREPDDQDDELE
jgi:hypothetical protein